MTIQLERALRESKDSVRITALLIDGATGDITRSVVAALKVMLLPAESKSIADRSTSSVQAYEYYLKGRSKFFETWGGPSTMKAQGL
jgi:adenylate cyclase